MSLLIENALLRGEPVCVLVEEGLVSKILPGTAAPPDLQPQTRIDKTIDKKIDARGKYIIPSLKNGHTHSAMTLLRGYADDMRLQPWLEEQIWPAEANLSPEDIYWGTRLAALEMIKSGTTFCNDMYFHFPSAWQAYNDSGIKAAMGTALFDFFDEEAGKNLRDETVRLHSEYTGKNERILFSPAPHAVYTVSETSLRWIADFARSNDLVVHIHLSETQKEVKDCLNKRGIRPTEYLEEIGFLGPNVIAAHTVQMSEGELDILERRGVTVVHNPVSNMKLASGNCFPFGEFEARGIPMMLGTDGCSSNNNLDMFEEMKVAALLQKHHFGDTELMQADEIFTIATGGTTKIYPHISSDIAPGAHADLLLIDPDVPAMVPVHNLVSNLVYSAGASAVDTVICDGQVLMEGRNVQDEDIVIREARRCAEELKKNTRA